MEAEQVKKITRDMPMGDILKVHPGTADIMNKFGLHCTGCGVAAFEPLDQGMMAHGYGEEEIQLLLKELNDFVADPNNYEKKQEEANAQDIIPLNITEKAVKKLVELRDNDEATKGQGVRVMVEAGGCAGHKYGMDFEKEPAKDDKIMNFGELTVYLDLESYKMLSGVEIDYVDSINETGFKFNNPNAKATCGCGSSFR